MSYKEFVNSVSTLYNRVINFYDKSAVDVLHIFPTGTVAHAAWWDVMVVKCSVNINDYRTLKSSCDYLFNRDRSGLLQLIACIGEQPATYGL